MLDEARMRVLNRRIEVDGEDVTRVAADALRDLGLRADACTHEHFHRRARAEIS